MFNEKYLFRPRKIFTLWDMIELFVREVVNLCYSVEYFVKQTEMGNWTPATQTNVKKALERSIPTLQKICPDGAQVLTERLISEIDSGMNLERAKHAATELRHRINDDSRAVFFLLLSHASHGQYTKANLFGEDVFNKFPSVTWDIAEAGKCLALDRGTACVFHLNRIVEVGLASLAKRLRIMPQTNWGAYLRQIDDNIKLKKARPIWFSRNEEFFKLAAIRIGAVKDVWRNPTTHHIERTYTPEQAKEIFDAIGQLMRHLATKLRE
jgi:hypothetical protein